ncbi:MAG: hypothetical protein ACKESB_01400 [Candidatus Hodgkinia cicadicola]
MWLGGENFCRGLQGVEGQVVGLRVDLRGRQSALPRICEFKA